MKEAILRYVKRVKKLFIAFSCVAIPAFMVFLVFALNGSLPFIIAAPVLGVAYLVVYALYAMNVSMGVVYETETTEQVVHLHTKRKIFTYDVKMGCVSMKVYKNKFVGVFQTQDSRDKFVFYRRVPFGKYSEEQFTREEIARFCPALADEEKGKTVYS